MLRAIPRVVEMFELCYGCNRQTSLVALCSHAYMRSIVMNWRRNPLLVYQPPSFRIIANYCDLAVTELHVQCDFIDF